MARVTDSNNWFEMWDADKRSLIETMARNMASDLENGYSYWGNSIQRQIAELEEYKAKYHAELDAMVYMTDVEVNRWCFYDLKKRGAIE